MSSPFHIMPHARRMPTGPGPDARLRETVAIVGMLLLAIDRLAAWQLWEEMCDEREEMSSRSTELIRKFRERWGSDRPDELEVDPVEGQALESDIDKFDDPRLEILTTRCGE